MAQKSKKKKIKLTNKFEVFFFKYKYYIVGFLLINLWPTQFILNLEDRNSLTIYCVLFTTIIIIALIFFLMPTYRKIRTTGDIWGIGLFYVLLLTLALSNIVLRINGLVGAQEKIDMHGIVIKTCKSSYKGHLKYNAIVNMHIYGKMNFRISEEAYAKIKKGSNFHQTWWVGSFGIKYWKNESK